MRRADRLFRVVQMLRSGRVLTGAQLAERLEISKRTLYRDVADLQASGVLIEGEPGVGYTLRRDMDLPPMQFTVEEMTALVLGARMTAAWGGEAMRHAAKRALGKIEAVLPEPTRRAMDAVQLYAPDASLKDDVRRRLDPLHGACVSRRVVRLGYERLDGHRSERRVRPLALAFWGGVWTLVAWCEERDDFRVFRVDRMHGMEVLEESFPEKRGQELAAFLAIQRGDEERLDRRERRNADQDGERRRAT